MEGSHPDTVPVPHTHVVKLDWYRTQLTVGRAILPDWDIEVVLPYDVKDVTAKYELPDGSSFNNPQGDVHHRTETLSGIGDLRLMVNHHAAGFHVGLGLSLPSGRVEEDPYELGSLGVKHQHIQFGTGTVDPLFHIGYGWTSGRWGLHANVHAHVPLYYGPEGYKAATVLDYSAGPSFALAEWLAVSLQYAGVYQSRAYWGSDVDPNSGYVMHGLSLAIPVRTGAWVLRPAVIFVLDIVVPEGDSFSLDWMFSFTVERIFD